VPKGNDGYRSIGRVQSDSLELQLPLLHAAIESYYSAKVARFGATPLGVDWTCIATQELRFVQLLKLCNWRAPFSINDLGCGYGAIIGYLAKYHRAAEVDYLGIDLSAKMVRHAKRKWHRRRSTRFYVGNISPRIADYTIASGIYNVKLDQPIDLWEEYVARSLSQMHATSRRGFAVNFKAPLSDKGPSPPQLYRTRPGHWMRFCQRALKASPELIAHYGLREFTLLVRR